MLKRQNMNRDLCPIIQFANGGKRRPPTVMNKLHRRQLDLIRSNNFHTHRCSPYPIAATTTGVDIDRASEYKAQKPHSGANARLKFRDALAQIAVFLKARGFIADHCDDARQFALG